MAHSIYSFDNMAMDERARALSETLDTRLYKMQSPLIGPWYDAADPVARLKAVKLGEMVEQPHIHLTVTPNDPEPGYLEPQFQDGSRCILHVHASPEEIAEIDEKLGKSGLRFKAHTAERRSI